MRSEEAPMVAWHDEVAAASTPTDTCARQPLREARQVPDRLDVVVKARHVHQVDRAGAADLISDVQVVGFCVLGRRHVQRLPTPMSITSPSPTAFFGHEQVQPRTYFLRHPGHPHTRAMALRKRASCPRSSSAPAATYPRVS